MTEKGVISTTELTDVVKKYFGVYAKYVIGDRAIPDIRDGLKPVHRRTIYAAWEMGARAPSRHVKCAKIVGNTMGNYHPHGDKGIYDALVRMTQEFSMLIPLFDGQGNMGSLDGDSPAAPRYTEARLNDISQDLFCNNLNNEVVNFIPTYDETTTEPKVLPAELPHILLNYNTGIGVGLATEILSCAPHEIIDCLIGEIDEGLVSKNEEKAPKKFKGPDLPLGGVIEYSKSQLNNLWTTGKSSWKVRGDAVFEVDEVKGDKKVVITSLPFQQQKDKWLEETAKMIVEKNEEGKKKLEGIADMRDESNKKHGVRIVFDIRPSSNPDVILKSLYKRTRLQKNLSTGIVATVEDKPKYVGVREILLRWLDFRRECMRNILNKEKREKEERIEIINGYLIIHKNLNKAIKTIREAENSKEALMKEFDLSERQATSIVTMRLGSLRKIDNDALIQENKDLKKRVEEIVDILKDPKKIDSLIKERLKWWKTKLPERRTQVVNEFGEISTLDTIVEKDVVVSINRKEEYKVTQVDAYRKVKRGGKGVKETDGEDSNEVPCLLAQVTTHDMLYAFTDKSRVFEKSCHELPITKRSGKRQPLSQLFSGLEEDEHVVAILAMNVMNMPEDASIIMIRDNGNVKKMLCTGLLKKRGRLWGDICCRTDLDDSKLVAVTLGEPEKDLIIFTRDGLFRRIPLDTLRATQSRKSGAPMCLKLDDEDSVINVATLNKDDNVVGISENAFGTRINESSLPAKKGRIGKGYKLVKTDKKTGKIIFGGVLNSTDELFVTTSGGKTLRMSASDIREVGKGCRGVRVQKMATDEHIVAATKIYSPKE